MPCSFAVETGDGADQGRAPSAHRITTGVVALRISTPGGGTRDVPTLSSNSR